MTSPLFPKTPLPCLHVWKLVRSLDEWDDYFECEKCHKQAPYDPSELADMEVELDAEE